MKVTGHCHCGQISFEAEVDSATVRVCHCTDCQKLTGTAFRAAIASLPGTFVLKSGTPKIYIKTAESGNNRAHAFCPECGTPIYAAAPEPNPLWIAGRRDRPARSTRTAGASDLVPLGSALVDGSDRHRAHRTAITRRRRCVTAGLLGPERAAFSTTLRPTGQKLVNPALLLLPSIVDRRCLPKHW